MARRPLDQRLDTLAVLDKVLRANATALAEAISADFGNRAHQETIVAELVPALAAIRNVRRNLRRWVRPERRRVDIAFQPGRAWVEWQPLGVVAIVSPWNYPLLLTVSPLVDAIAAGNRVMVKPSELVPRFSALFARLIEGAIDPAIVTVVTGGPDVARAVCALPLDHLLFTGSTTVGRLVARAAAETLTPVTLELGGKSPAIVCRDYDIAAAAKTIALGKFFNAGQTCIAPDYALVPNEHVDAFAQAVIRAVKAMYPRVGGNADYTAIVSDRHHDRLHGLLREAELGGARLLRLDDAPDERRMGPTVVLDPPLDGALMGEEIFGPILPGDRLPGDSGGDQVRPRPASPVGAVSVHARSDVPGERNGPYGERRRFDQQCADALHPGRPAVRRRRAVRHRRLPRPGRVSPLLPRARRVQGGPVQRLRVPGAPLWPQDAGGTQSDADAVIFFRVPP